MGRLIFGLLVLSALGRAELFYEITHKGATVFILGSIHAGKPDSFPLNDTVEKAYTQSKIIAVEVDLDDPQTAQKAQKLILASINLSGDALSMYLSPSVYSKWKQYALQNNISKSWYERFRPWALVLQMSEWEMKKSGYEAQWGIDRYFLAKSHLDNKQIISLETIEEQFALLSDPRYEEKLLEYSIDSANDVQFSLDKMFHLWKKGDEKSFEIFLNEQSSTDSKHREIVERVIERRNIKMAEKIEQLLLSGEKTMVIIGSAHLVGEKGVVSLLREKGYRVSKVKNFHRR